MSDNLSSFDKFFESVVNTVKKAGTVAGQKTTEAVEIGKIKYKEQSVERELTKTYTKLGALVYESRTKGEDLEEVIAENIAKITELSQQLDDHAGAFATAIEEIKKPISEITKDINVSASTTVDKVEDAVENVVDEVTEKAHGVAGEIDDIIDDFKDKN